MADLREHFEEKVEKDGGKWRWTASVNSDGYPKIKDNGKLRLASHVALELSGRAAPKADQVVLHKDNDPKNIAPSNLSVGTQQENLKQMRDEGRDRPRGVKQAPDVKQASAVLSSGTRPLQGPAKKMVQLAQSAFSKKAMMAAFSDELQKILTAKD
jgi:hypothetical protein